MNDTFEYEAPKVYTLGTVEELTQQPDAKCGGSGDQFLPQQLSNIFTQPQNCP